MSSVIRVGLITASRIILGHWKTANPLNLKDWENMMVYRLLESYESALNSQET